MAIKIFGILMALFALVLVFLSTQDLYSIEIEQKAIDFNNIEAFELYAYELNASEVKANYQALKWLRYESRDLFDEIKVFTQDFNLSSKEALVVDKNITFNGDVLYNDINDTKISTQRLFYDGLNKNAYTDTEFKAYKGANLLVGKELDYDLDDKILHIKGKVKAWLISN